MFRPEIELFNDSLARCLQGDRFFQRFYELFLASSEEVREKFRATDFRRQTRMVKSSFYMLVEYLALGWPECEAYLQRIAVAHGKRERNIAPHLYDLWLDSLLQTVKECDDRYSPQVEAAWRYVMGAGITFLKTRYDTPGAAGEAPA